MNNNEGFKITAHQPANPFAGKKFKIVTYQGDKELASQAITIESQLELKTTLDEVKQFNIKQFNIAQEELVKSGYTQKSILVKKLITE